jgi:hypothetical protein
MPNLADYTGGTITPGLYWLTDVVVYGGQVHDANGSVLSGATGGTEQIAANVGNGTLDWLASCSNGPTSSPCQEVRFLDGRFHATLDVVTTGALSLTYPCASGITLSGEPLYTATGTTLTVAVPGGAQVVFTLALQQ